MNQYITGAMIRRLREEKDMTQSALAEKLNVSGKTVSKWETGKGYPDISLVESLAAVLGISVIELFSGNDVANRNPGFNMLRTKYYVCPICGNIITATGEATVSCHGITLPPLEAEAEDEAHHLNIEKVEDEWYVSLDHPMTKTHYISFFAAVSDNGVELKKCYAEGMAEARFKVSRTKYLLYFCNRHGLFRMKTPKISRRSGGIVLHA